MWIQNTQRMFVAAPAFPEERLAQLPVNVAEIIRSVKGLSYRRGSRSPFTCAFDPTLERIPNPNATALYSINHTRNAPKFFTKGITAATGAERQQAWLERRPTLIMLLNDEVNANTPGRVFFDRFTGELDILLGAEHTFAQLAGAIVSSLHHYTVLCCNCLVYCADQMYCPEYTPLKALHEAVRGEGVELEDLYARMEMLALQSRHREAESPMVLYSVCAAEDSTLIPDLHNYTIAAIRRDKSRPWAEELARAMDRACHEARKRARVLPAADRPEALTLANISYYGQIGGLDEMCAAEHALRRGNRANYERPALGFVEPQRKPPKPKGRVIASALPPPTRALIDTGSRSEYERIVAAAAPPPPPRFQPRPQGPGPQGSGRPSASPSGDSDMPPKPNVAEERYRHYYINFPELQTAAEGSDEVRKRLAISLWPDDTCSRFASEIPCEPTVPVLDSEGKPKKTGQRPWMTYGAPKSCRWCSIWAPRNRVDMTGWQPAFRQGSHNPRECSRAILYLLQNGPAGASFLRENTRNRGNPMGDNRGGQRRE